MPAFQKKKMRLLMKEKRRALSQKNPQAGEKIASHFFKFFDLPAHTIVGAYWPIGTELDSRPLLQHLLEKGFQCVLPRLSPEGLAFHQWTPSLSLKKGNFNIHEPPETAPVMIPDMALVPLLAFDKYGHRLGYGQGHYDRFLHAHPMTTVGVGFREQEIEQIPRQTHDFALDFILTEEGIISPREL